MSAAFDGPSVTIHYRLCRPSVRGPEVDALAGQLLPVAGRRGPCTLLLDFAGVDFLTAAALGGLVALHARLRDLGGRLVLANLSPRLREVFEVVRLDTLLDLRRARASHPDTQRPLAPVLSV